MACAVLAHAGETMDPMRRIRAAEAVFEFITVVLGDWDGSVARALAGTLIRTGASILSKHAFG